MDLGTNTTIHTKSDNIFVGRWLSAPQTWTVSPGVAALITVLKQLAAEGGPVPKLVSMSAMGIGDSKVPLHYDKKNT